ncbi:hypothetical protein IFM53868_07334 [Aspergillus udagawae]|uniref:Uncharacterized protein n=1 Tax=Aspergillus udagawae TaxID=91492 RepID=A0ABQ1B7Q2_9EURO|nr:hypothetical protein IFM53868_07334 [Aspergillus udagawae]GFG19964.1 hypothetical protein IFM5058_10401 [Aspergillus udagawae]
MHVSSAILSILAAATLASAGDWGFTGFTETDCKGNSPVGFGDQKAYGCTNLDTKATIMSIDGDVDGFEIALFPENDCKGNFQQYIRDSNTCSSAGRGDFPQIKSFKVYAGTPY